MKRHLILGSAGLIGTSLARRLSNAGHVVLGVDSYRSARALPEWRLPSYRWRLSLVPDAATTEKLDVRHHDQVADLIRRFRPSAVYYLATLLETEARQNPQEANEVQIDAFANVLEVLGGQTDPVHVVLASSSYVYGHFENQVADEDRPPNPVDVYGRAKVRAEELMRAARWPDLTWTILRPAAVYGVGDPRARYSSTMIEQCAKDRAITLEMPEFSADFTHVEDAARAFEAAAEPRHHGLTVNVTRGDPQTNRSFAEAVCRLRPDTRMDVSDAPMEPYVPRRGYIDSSLAARTLGWQARTAMHDGIAEELAIAEKIYTEAEGQAVRPGQPQ